MPLPLSLQLLLLHYKANADARDNNGNTPLHFACMYGHEDVCQSLTSCPTECFLFRCRMSVSGWVKVLIQLTVNL